MFAAIDAAAFMYNYRRYHYRHRQTNTIVCARIGLIAMLTTRPRDRESSTGWSSFSPWIVLAGAIVGFLRPFNAMFKCSTGYCFFRTYYLLFISFMRRSVCWFGLTHLRSVKAFSHLIGHHVELHFDPVCGITRLAAMALTAAATLMLLLLLLLLPLLLLQSSVMCHRGNACKSRTDWRNSRNRQLVITTTITSASVISSICQRL